MADSPYPIPLSIRQTDVLLGTGATRYGPFGTGWGIFDIADVVVETRLAAGGVWTTIAATIEKVALSNRYSSFYVTFPSAITSDTAYRITGQRNSKRQLAVTRGGSIDGVALEEELSKQIVVQQELRRDVGSLLNIQSTASNAAIAAAASATAAAASAAIAAAVIGLTIVVTSVAALKALVPPAVKVAVLSLPGRSGIFEWRTDRDFTTAVAVDTENGVYAKANSLPASSGCWERSYGWIVETSWCGAIGNGVAYDDVPLDKALKLAHFDNVGLGYTGRDGTTFRRSTAHIIDLNGDDTSDATMGMIIRGMGNQRSRIDVREVTTTPQASIRCISGFVGTAISAISGNGATVTVSWANTITPNVGAVLQIAGCSIAGYNGAWFMTSTGPGTATFAGTTTGTPGTLGTATYQVIQANSYIERFGFLCDTNNVGLEIGQQSFAEQMNRTTFDLTVTNARNVNGCCAVEINALYHCFGNINATLGGVITAGSDAIRVRKMAFSKIALGGSNAYNGSHYTTDFIFGNTIEVPDMEVVTNGVVIDSSSCIENTFVGGTLGHTSLGYVAIAGSRNRIINPNVNSAQPVLSSSAAFRVGLLLDRGDFLGYNGLVNFGNQYAPNAQYIDAAAYLALTGLTLVSGRTIPAPPDAKSLQVILTSGTFAALTITLPASPVDGLQASYHFINLVTALTVAGGSVLGGAPSAVSNLKSTFSFRYLTILGQWIQEQLT